MSISMDRGAAPLREGEALLDCDTVCAFFGSIHSATLYRGIAAGRYPAPIKIGPNTSRWLRSECEASLAAMMARRGQ
jgi:predicted DNA-binding transcriptional regulator AlpA